MKSNKEIINEVYPDLVTNWGESAHLLSFTDVVNLMHWSQSEVLKALKTDRLRFAEHMMISLLTTRDEDSPYGSISSEDLIKIKTQLKQYE